MSLPAKYLQSILLQLPFLAATHCFYVVFCYMSLLAEYLHSILLQLPFGQAYFAAVSLEDCRLKMLCIMQIVQGSTRTASETTAKHT